MQITGGYRDGYPRHQKIEKSGQNTAIRNNDSKVRQQTNPHLVNEVKMPLARIQPLLTYCKGQAGRGGADTKREAEHKIQHTMPRNLCPYWATPSPIQHMGDCRPPLLGPSLEGSSLLGLVPPCADTTAPHWG